VLYVAIFRASGWLQLIVRAFGSVIFLHDPVSFAALVRPDLFTFRKGVVRVETQGICAGHTSMDMLLKKYATVSQFSVAPFVCFGDLSLMMAGRCIFC
jgi:inosine-uridine nucleoside N-ribohydrolase